MSSIKIVKNIGDMMKRDFIRRVWTSHKELNTIISNDNIEKLFDDWWLNGKCIDKYHCEEEEKQNEDENKQETINIKSLKDMKLSELRPICKSLGLICTGTKRSLMDRIIASVIPLNNNHTNVDDTALPINE